MNPLSGWGIGPFGLSPYGSGAVGAISATGFYIENAVLLSSHELLVTFSMPFNYEMAVDPNSWDIRDDTSVIQIGVYGVQPLNLTQAIVCLQSAAAPFAHEFSVGGAILSSMGDVLDPPRASFFGVNLPDDAVRTQRKDYDFANPFLTPDGKGGTLSIGSGGDYNVESGRDLILKLVIRRLVATPRDFIFYPDAYGVGLKINVPLYLTDLARLRVQVQQSLEQEPELEAIQVSVTLDTARSILTINIRGRIRRTSAPFSIDVPLDTSTVSFT
jgi:hypothetical protein